MSHVILCLSSCGVVRRKYRNRRAELKPAEGARRAPGAAEAVR